MEKFRGSFENYLFSNGFVSSDDLVNAIQLKDEKGVRILDVLIDENFVSELDAAHVLSLMTNVSFIDLEKELIGTDVIRLVPESIVSKYEVIPVRIENGFLVVATSFPLDVYLWDDVQLVSGLDVVAVCATRSAVRRAIHKYYGDSRSQTYVNEFIMQSKDADSTINNATSDKKSFDVDSSPTVKFVDNLLQQAVNVHASDIHIEPFETFSKIRFRVDGCLRIISKIDNNISSNIISRIKVLSNMDIAQHLLPQDGHVRAADVDLRISTMPTIFGEKAVVRLIYKTGFLYNKNDLGLSALDLEKLNTLLKNNTGIILVTGPTGSGKTTTLAACIQELSSEENNIVTIEDPVEYVLEDVTQINVNYKLGLTFANALRSILRQDPDIIMIGEMRDYDTAQIGIRAAITGHLVLSTLHTNDAVSSIIRLIDMGIEPYLVASAVKGIISQRLVRVICPHCKIAVKISSTDALLLKIPEDSIVYMGQGCHLCDNTGFSGRTGVFEVLALDYKLHDLIISKPPLSNIYHYIIQNGFVTLADSALVKVIDGVTTVGEYLKVAYRNEYF